MQFNPTRKEFCVSSAIYEVYGMPDCEYHRLSSSDESWCCSVAKRRPCLSRLLNHLYCPCSWSSFSPRTPNCSSLAPTRSSSPSSCTICSANCCSLFSELEIFCSTALLHQQSWHSVRPGLMNQYLTLTPSSELLFHTPRQNMSQRRPPPLHEWRCPTYLSPSSLYTWTAICWAQTSAGSLTVSSTLPPTIVHSCIWECLTSIGPSVTQDLHPSWWF